MQGRRLKWAGPTSVTFFRFVVQFAQALFKGTQAVILIIKKNKKPYRLLQLKFFIIAYVNSLERRKYVAV
jgi:hypothetical protein